MRSLRIIWVIVLSVGFFLTACNAAVTPLATKKPTISHTPTFKPTYTNQATLIATVTPRVWKGLYKQNFEYTLFWPCENPLSESWWWADGNIRKLSDFTAPLDDFTPVYVEVIGDALPKADNEYLYGLNKKIVIYSVLQLQTDIPEECTLPY